MAMPIRIQRKRAKGWRMPQNTIYVGRPTTWGNPWTVAAAVAAGYSAEHAPQMAVYAYREWLRGNLYYPGYDLLRDHVLTNIDDLRGHDLACWCPLDRPCHANTLLEMAND